MIVTLDLDELADEWQELLDEQEALGEHPMEAATREEYDAISEEMAKFEDLCDELGCTPVQPSTLRRYDETFIREDTFEDYARELAEDVSGVNMSQWPATCIDWSKAADELRMDYTTITYDGEDYLTR